MLALQERIQGEIPVGHPVMLWLVEHSGDGCTAFERLFGKPSRGDGYDFGEQARCRVRPGDVGRSLNPRWEPGTWLGRHW
eukprot:558983-Alexandrium_andersonii.AAC.1